MDEPRDDILVRRALAGDTTGFGRLCQRYYPALVAMAYAIVGEGHAAEDAAQETLAVACRRLRTLREPERFGAWLGAICRNTARDILTDRGRQRRVAAEAVTPGSHDNGDEKALLMRAVRALPEGLREVVVLRYYHAMSYEHMAGLLNLSRQTVNGRLRRARKRIATYMKANGFGDDER